MTTLSDVKRYMQDHHRVTVDQLALGVSTTPDNARSLLEMWRAKNRVRFIPSSCGSCGKGKWGGCNCSVATIDPEVYEWVEDKERQPNDS